MVWQVLLVVEELQEQKKPVVGNGKKGKVGDFATLFTWRLLPYGFLQKSMIGKTWKH